MSDAVPSQGAGEPAVVALASAPQGVAVGFPVPLSAFAASLRPRRVPLVRNGKQVVSKGRVVMTVTHGHADEIWLKLLRIRHGNERRTPAEWSALIDGYREQPAHAADPRTIR